MSTENKTYFPGIIREKSFSSGKTILTLGIPVDDFIALLQQHKKPSGWINLAISSRKEVGPKGQTHCLWLDTWEPNKEGQSRAVAPAPRAAARPAEQTAPPPEEDDVPF